MSRKNLFFVLFCMLCCLTALTPGCGQSESQIGPGVKPVVIVDSAGRSVELPQPLEKVVILNTDVAEAMRILKVHHNVLGVSDTIQKDPYLGLQDRDFIGKWNTPNYEKIVELKPQVVVSYSGTPGLELAEKLEPAGIKVVFLDLFKPETYNDDLKTLGKMFGKEEEANSFIKWKDEKIVMLERLNDLKTEQKPKVFGMWASNFQKEQWKTFATGTSVHQGIEMAGGINIARKMENYPEVSPEWILQQDPHVVIMALAEKNDLGYKATNLSSAEGLQEDIVNHKVFNKTTAAREKRVYFVSTSMLGGDKTYLGALYLAKWFYPDRFMDVEPDQVLQEYFETWLDVPFQGKWAFPPVLD
jgi:iron complex transport system substrate-binding protein